MDNNQVSKETLDKAVRVALQENSKSSVMFLLRERLSREVIEAAIPIIIEPLVNRINELEKELQEMREIEVRGKTVTSPKLSQLKEALSDMVEAIDSDPLKGN